MAHNKYNVLLWTSLEVSVYSRGVFLGGVLVARWPSLNAKKKVFALREIVKTEIRYLIRNCIAMKLVFINTFINSFKIPVVVKLIFY